MYQFLSPVTTAEALEFLKERKNLRILAGGTDLIIALKDGTAVCDHLMDIKKIPALKKMEQTRDGLEIGAAVTLGEMLASGILQEGYRAIGQSAASVANSLLRNRATLAGNICNASPGGDMLPACLVADAYVQTIAPAGGRSIPLRDFFVGVKKHVLQADELVVKVVIPKANGVSAFRKKKRIRGHDLAQVSVAVSYSATGVLRMAFGAAAPTPLLIELGAYQPEVLREKRNEIVDGAVEHASPIDDTRSSKAYRTAMLRHLAHEAINEILEEAEDTHL